jgi:hypothetical protein
MGRYLWRQQVKKLVGDSAGKIGWLCDVKGVLEYWVEESLFCGQKRSIKGL